MKNIFYLCLKHLVYSGIKHGQNEKNKCVYISVSPILWSY